MDPNLLKDFDFGEIQVQGSKSKVRATDDELQVFG